MKHLLQLCCVEQWAHTQGRNSGLESGETKISAVSLSASVLVSSKRGAYFCWVNVIMSRFNSVLSSQKVGSVPHFQKVGSPAPRLHIKLHLCIYISRTTDKFLLLALCWACNVCVTVCTLLPLRGSLYCLSVCLSVWLSVKRIVQKVLKWFSWNSVGLWLDCCYWKNRKKFF